MKKKWIPILLLCIISIMSNCKEDIEDTNTNAEKKVTITFNTDGGNSISSKTVSYNSTIDYKAEKAGYSFKGWFIDKDFNTPFDLEKPISEQIIYKENITLYAKFSQKLYRVIYDGDENTEGEVPVDDNLYAEGDMFKPVWNYRLQKNLYPFQGWQVIGASPNSYRLRYYPQKNIYFAYVDTTITVDKSDIKFIAVYETIH